jgi:hypothetical protein
MLPPADNHPFLHSTQSILLATPTAPMEDYKSIQKFSDEGGEGDDKVAMETGTDTDTNANYQDALTSILLATLTASMEDYKSIQMFSNEGGKGDNNNAKSIKALLLVYRRDADAEELLAVILPELAHADPPPPPPRVSYESQAVQVEPAEEPMPMPA